jgi:hypothetical protein
MRLRCQPSEDGHDMEEWLKKEERNPCAVSASRWSWSPPTADVDVEELETDLHHGEGAIIRQREMRHTSSLPDTLLQQKSPFTRNTWKGRCFIQNCGGFFQYNFSQKKMIKSPQAQK